MKKIMDAIARANPNLSRQRIYQLRQRRKGRCILCRKRAVTALHCAEHAQAASGHSLRAYHRKKLAMGAR